jgi:hypothetical protein
MSEYDREAWIMKRPWSTRGCCAMEKNYTGYTQKNGAVLIVFTIKTAPLFCVCPVLCYVILGSNYTKFLS